MTATIDLSAVRGGATLTSRLATRDDAGAVLQLVNACELHDLGEALLEADDLAGDWQRPSFDLGRDSCCVFDGSRLVAYGEVYRARRAEGNVHPDARGRGLGAALLRWTWDVSRAGGGTRVGQTVVEVGDAARLFETYGYEPRWTSWILTLPVDAAITPTRRPDDVVVRPLVRGEERAAFQVVEDAFNEWADRDPSTYEDWAAGVLDRPGFEPWQLLVAVEQGAIAEPGESDETLELGMARQQRDARQSRTTKPGQIVGVCHLLVSADDGWIDHLAVRADRRGRGLGRALLGHAFAAARERGAVRCELSTDSRTGALSLYAHVGMQVRQSFTHYVKRLVT